MIKLYQFKRAFNVANPSPFCMKVETYLRLAGLQYELVTVGNPSKLPKGKAPVIEHEGHTVPDSTHILEYLEERFSPGLDRGLDAATLAACHAFARLLEERFYWTMVYSRWVDRRCWPTVRDTWFGDLPRPLGAAVGAIVQRGVRRTLHGQGVGRHSPDQIYAFARRDIAAVSEWLGDKPYFTGNAPCTIDAVVYAFMANAIDVPFDTELEAAARALPNLLGYCARMRERYFTDL